MKPEDYGYVLKNNMCLFQKGPLSQWWGGFKGQQGGFYVNAEELTTFTHSDTRDYVKAIKSPLEFNCCEQWMMANKATLCGDIETFEKIMKTTNPKDQKALGREVKNFNSGAWDIVKFNVVKTGNALKFRQNEELKEFLRSFHIQTIFAEASPWDKIWGIGLGPEDPKSLDLNTWEGENLLGLVISSVRQSHNLWI